MSDSESTSIGYAAVDADGHYYEPHDAFTRHIDPKFRDRAVHVVKGDDGLGRLYLGDKKFGMMKVTQTDYTGAPGSRVEYFQGLLDDGTGWQQTEVIDAHDHPPMMQKSERLALMDQQGLEATMLFPSVGLAVEHELHDDADVLYANLRAFNRWLEEDWGFGEDGRVYSAPMLSLIDVDQAIEELERVLRLGAKVIHLKRGPLYGGSPADPSKDRFWAIVQEANVPVAFHTGDAGYYEVWGAVWGEQARPPLQYTSAFNQYLMSFPMADTAANLILNNLFVRFPKLRILSIENGSSWIPWTLKNMDKAAAMARGSDGLGGKFLDKASDVFKEHFFVCPFFEDDPVALVEHIGVERVLFGSDWPHPEGLAEPLDFAKKVVGRVDEVTERRIMRGNAAELIGLAP
jgi:predicted TIM-barrel fold metal-dependent hydrolase